jgi:hypothetical protein
MHVIVDDMASHDVDSAGLTASERFAVRQKLRAGDKAGTTQWK